MADPQGYTAPQAAGVIHTDFEKGFIKADIVSYDDFVAAEGSMTKIKEEASSARKAAITSCRTATSWSSSSTSRSKCFSGSPL